MPLQVNAELSSNFLNLLWIPYLEVAEVVCWNSVWLNSSRFHLVEYLQSQRLVVGSYLLLILQSDVVHEMTWCETFSALQLEFYGFATDHKCKFVTYFVINHPSQFSIRLSLLLVQWYTAGANERRNCQFAPFEGKKPHFSVHQRFSFHPIRGGSLKFIFSSSAGLGFALPRTRGKIFVTVSTLCNIGGGRKQGNYWCWLNQYWIKTTHLWSVEISEFA